MSYRGEIPGEKIRSKAEKPPTLVKCGGFLNGSPVREYRIRYMLPAQSVQVQSSLRSLTLTPLDRGLPATGRCGFNRRTDKAFGWWRLPRAVPSAASSASEAPLELVL
jgi:hypothetical protein